MAHLIEAAIPLVPLETGRVNSMTDAMKDVDLAYAQFSPSSETDVSPVDAARLLIAARPFFMFALSIANVKLRRYAPYIDAKELERKWLKLEKTLTQRKLRKST